MTSARFRSLIFSLLLVYSAQAYSFQTTLTQTFHGYGISVNYPAEWLLTKWFPSTDQPSMSTIAPASASAKTKSGKDWRNEGIHVGTLESPSGGLEGTVQTLFRWSNDSPLVRVGGSKPIQIAGHRGLLVEYSNTNPDAPSPESGLIAAMDLDGGRVVFLVFFCPTSKKIASFTTYRKIIQSITFDPSTTPPPSAASRGSSTPLQAAADHFIDEHFSHCGDSFYMMDYAQTMWMGVRQFRGLHWSAQAFQASETEKLNGITDKASLTLSATAHRIHGRDGSWSQWQPGFSTFTMDLENRTGITNGTKTIDIVRQNGVWRFRAPIDIDNSKRQSCSYFNQGSLQ